MRMKTVYVVMKETQSPVYANYSRPDAAFKTLKEAKNHCDAKNKASRNLAYYIYKAKWGSNA